MDYDSIAQIAKDAGLALRGGFHPRPEDQVPPLPDGRRAATLILLGNVGSAVLWPRFADASEMADGLPDPLNRWSQRVIEGLATDLNALAVFPFGGPPYHPFIAWAKRAEAVTESPLGILIHPDFGLWHAYRGALAFVQRLDLPDRDLRPSPCLDCAERPCLTACPAEAFTGQNYKVEACVTHLEAHQQGPCMTESCLARRACPVGQNFHYEPDHAAFHMAAFYHAQQKAQTP